MNSLTSRWNFKTALLALICIGACAVPGAQDQEEIREDSSGLLSEYAWLLSWSQT
jgi:hypothetical protein